VKSVLAVISGLGKTGRTLLSPLLQPSAGGLVCIVVSNVNHAPRPSPERDRSGATGAIGSTSGRSTSAVAVGAGTVICSVLASTSAPDRLSPPSQGGFDAVAEPRLVKRDQAFARQVGKKG
jgi:hypothetical protein